MAEQSKELSPYIRAARHKWPNFAVSGDGEWVIVCPTTGAVKLYDFAMLAKLEKSQSCSDQCCPTLHKLVKIAPVYPRPPVYLSFVGKD